MAPNNVNVTICPLTPASYVNIPPPPSLFDLLLHPPQASSVLLLSPPSLTYLPPPPFSRLFVPLKPPPSLSGLHPLQSPPCLSGLLRPSPAPSVPFRLRAREMTSEGDQTFQEPKVTPPKTEKSPDLTHNFFEKSHVNKIY